MGTAQGVDNEVYEDEILCVNKVNYLTICSACNPVAYALHVA